MEITGYDSRSLWWMVKVLPTKSCNMILLVAKSGLTLLFNNRTADERRLVYFLQNSLFQFWQDVTILQSTNSSNLKKMQQQSTRKLWGALHLQKDILLNFFQIGEDECFPSIDTASDLDMKCWSYVSSLVTIWNRNSLPSWW